MGQVDLGGLQAGSMQHKGNAAVQVLLAATPQGLWLQGGAHTQDWSHNERGLQVGRGEAPPGSAGGSRCHTPPGCCSTA